jgi:hypothetical protein
LSGFVIPERDSKGRVIGASVKPSGLSDGTLVTHDLCDKTTWYQQSTEHTGVALSLDSGTTYKNSSHTHWIDLTHGKLYGEDSLSDQKEPKVYDNGVEVTSGFSINYADGSVTFDSTPTGPVTADFWKAGSSLFTVTPDSGKVLALEHAELQFSEDVVMSAAINFEIWVYNPADLPNKVPYKTIKYKNIKDIINAANLGQGYIPKISGLQNNIIVFPFNYIATKPLASSVGAELRISIDGDVEFSGEWATATFYFLSEDE